MTHDKSGSLGELPDAFARPDGSRCVTREQWPMQREHLASLFMTHVYGKLPPVPADVHLELLHEHRYGAFDGAEHRQYRVKCDPDRPPDKPIAFILDVVNPRAACPSPVLLTGDGCWCTVNESVMHEALRRGYMVARFNRLELVSDPSRDPGHGARKSGLHGVCPDLDFGAIAAWAWGYHRAVDALEQIEEANAKQIVITGHSRGGKTVLLAGALDERIAMTAANGSGCAGAACFRWSTPQCETLDVLADIRPSWFCRQFAEYAHREDVLPVDQHMLLSLIAPRALLITEAIGDVRANPAGTWQSYRAARDVYQWMHAPDQIGLRYRGGGHDHSYDDFVATLEFADWRLRGIPPVQCFHPVSGPFNDLPRIWRQPPKA